MGGLATVGGTTKNVASGYASALGVWWKISKGWVTKDGIWQQILSSGIPFNIYYGTTAPSDTTMLWVKLSDKPKVEKIMPVTDGAPNYAELEFSNTSVTARRITQSCVVDGNIWFYDSNTHSSTKAIIKYSVANKTAEAIGSTYRTYAGMVQHNGTIYVLAYSTDSGSWSYYYKIRTLASDGTTMASSICDSYCDTYFSAPVSDGSYIWYLSSTNGSTSGEAITKMCQFNPSASSVTRYALNLTLYRPSKLCYLNGKLYFLGSTVSSDYSYNLYSYNIASGAVETVISGVFSQSVYSLGAFPLDAINGLLYSCDMYGNMYIMNPASGTFDTYKSVFASYDGKSNDVSLSAAINGCWYVRDLLGQTTTSVGDLYKYTPQELPQGELRVVYDGTEGAWQAITDDEVSLKIDPVLAVVGDTNNQPVPVEAYLYDESTSSWVALSGASTTADMISALSVLGVE